MHFPERLPEGSLLGGYYRISAFLGAGGMADVYAGIQTDTGARIALKILKPAPDKNRQAAFNKRFLREAQIAAQIDHHNVVRILAFRTEMTLRLPEGDTGTFHRPYLVMEQLQGHDLADEIDKFGPLEPKRALKLLSGALDGLSIGHKKGVVHKDLKPSNLFVVNPRHPRRENLVILDFGVARLGQGTGETLTAQGQLFTTAPYAAPEYIREQVVSPALDVYQMGLVLAEMLTGQMVVNLNTQEMTPEAYMMACAIAHTSGVKLDPKLKHGEVGKVLQRATALEPTQRYVDAEAFCEALDTLNPAQIALAMDINPEARTQRMGSVEGPALPPPTTSEQDTPTSTPAQTPIDPAPKPTTQESVTRSSSGCSLMVGGMLGVAITTGLLLVALVGIVWWAYQNEKKQFAKRPAPASKLKQATTTKPTCASDQHFEQGQCIPKIKNNMALVPKGPFTMGFNGSDEDIQDERPSRQVSLDAFWIDIYEVSVGQYRACVDTGACTTPVKTHQHHEAYNWDASGRGSHPINGVTWSQAKSYCAWKNKDLPTEAQWEKAARGTSAAPYPWGEAPPDCRRAMMDWGGDGCGKHSTAPVESMPEGKSPYGVHHMAGNVWEWTLDVYRPDGYYGLPDRNPTVTAGGGQRVLRGGGWYSDPDDLRTTNRYAVAPAVARSHFGFRCTRSDIEAKEKAR